MKIAVAWLDERDWPRWQAMDPELPNYKRWLEKIDAAIASAKASGITPVKIEIDPDAHTEWCKGTRMTIGRESRSQHAAVSLLIGQGRPA